VRAQALAAARVSASHVIFAVVAVAVGWLLLSRLDYVPIWDGLIYASEINRAATNVSGDSFRLAGHVSHAYAALAIGAQMLAPGQYWPLLLSNMVLFAVAVAGFYRLVRFVFPAPELEAGRALLTAAFALQPTILAGVVQPGIDLPLVPAFLWTTVFLLERRWSWVIAGGIVLAFTKETGVLLYGALMASWVVTSPSSALGIGGSRRQAFGRLVALSIPVVVFGAYLLFRARTAPSGEPVAWGVSDPTSAWQTLRMFIVPRVDRRLVSYSAVMLAMNFAWVMTLAIGAVTFLAVRRIVRREASVRELVTSTPTSLRLMVVLTVALGYALTRFSTYTNPRYLMVVTPFLLLLFFGALQYLVVAARTRALVLATFAMLVGVSATRTIDPVSRGAFGTFPVGDHRMLRMTSITGECCAYGRDQLVYNLEFTNIARAADGALALMQPGDSTLIVFPDWTNWYAMGLIDPRTGRRTLDPSIGVAPITTETDSVEYFAGEKPAAVYLDLPNGRPDGRLARLAPDVAASGERRVSRGGYVVSAYRLSFRAEARSAGVEESPSSR
jgi:hypothetical protein